MHHPMLGVGRYFETPQAAAEGETFDITGVDANYQAPVAGMGRYFETPQAYDAGERFDITGVNENFQAPVAGMGRYFETPQAYAAGERFDITGVDDNYQAPVAGMGRYVTSPALGELFMSEKTSKLMMAFRVLSYVGLGMGAYHGYKRSGDKVGPAIGYALLGSIFAPIAIPVFLAQGFGKRKKG